MKTNLLQLSQSDLEWELIMLHQESHKHEGKLEPTQIMGDWKHEKDGTMVEIAPKIKLVMAQGGIDRKTMMPEHPTCPIFKD